ncbi:hypothetical protein Clacol_007703 [Clathrus columnatus]|uniref:Uncharacterized protein n=1 Tax=Clathrus columnatus TaxID=1419009 RepID=A0AAV5AL74_9AGAM|nr:hypothetical protein Clacol_007703 [Clathrus columnatus]
MGCQVSSLKSGKKKQVGEHLIPTANIPSLTQLTQTSASPQHKVAQTVPPETPQVSQSLPTTTSNHRNDLLPSPSAGRVGFNNHFRQVRNLDLEIQQNTISQAFVYGSPPRQSHTSIPYYTPSPPIDIPHRHSPRSNIVPFQNPPYPIDIPNRYSPHYPTIPTGFHYSKSNRTPPSHSPSQGSLYSTQRQQNDYHTGSHLPRFIANYSDHSAPFLPQEEHVSQLHLDHEPTSGPPFNPTSEYPMSSLPFPPIYDQTDSPRSFHLHNNRNSVLGLDLDPEQARSATSSSGSLPNYLGDRITSSALARHNENYNRGMNSTSHVEGNRSTSKPPSPAFSVRHEQDGKLFIVILNRDSLHLHLVLFQIADLIPEM